MYWHGRRESLRKLDDLIHMASYLCMGWLNFLVLSALLRDALLGVAWLANASVWHTWLATSGTFWVWVASFVALAVGLSAAAFGPSVVEQVIELDNLPPAFEGLRIVQISDLHVGPTIGRSYVEHVVDKSNRLNADFVVLTGDIVDGSVARLMHAVAPLGELKAKQGVFFVPGNHDCYSGPRSWCDHFRSLGMHVLLNEYKVIQKDDAKLIMGGVVDPAIRMFDPTQAPNPDLASAPEEGEAVRILLAHNPVLATRAAKAGFDLQLSGHTHAGQFFPWTMAVRMIHAPHVAGLSRLDSMWVYVNAGTGSWGPPVRFGTKTELTLLRLMRTGKN